MNRIVLALVLVAGAAASFLQSETAAAMEFSTQRLADGDYFVLAKGEIIAGDLERLRVALRTVGRDRYGNKAVALDSGGGLVGEALKIVRLMDEEKVSTVILSGAKCASACAQIVFLAGVHRIVAQGGLLGMHTCSVDRNKSPLCNQTIAQNALEHGTPYGSVMAFMEYTGPSEMVWFNSQDADCFGLTRWPESANRGTKPGEIAPCVREAVKRR